jgi:hypothetical protein
MTAAILTVVIPLGVAFVSFAFVIPALRRRRRG